MLWYSWLKPGQIVCVAMAFGPLQPAVVGIRSSDAYHSDLCVHENQPSEQSSNQNVINMDQIIIFFNISTMCKKRNNKKTKKEKTKIKLDPIRCLNCATQVSCNEVRHCLTAGAENPRNAPQPTKGEELHKAKLPYLGHLIHRSNPHILINNHYIIIVILNIVDIITLYNAQHNFRSGISLVLL